MTAKHKISEDIIRPAFTQTTVAKDKLLTSTNAGLIVHRKGTVKGEFRSEGRVFARELAEYITTSKIGVASVFVYEETFGAKDVVHWFLHISDLGAYDTMVKMGDSDPAFREVFFKERVSADKGGGTWARVFLDGSISETVLLPQFSGMYGTNMENQGGTRLKTEAHGDTLPSARHQTGLEKASNLNSVTSGVVLLRSAQVRSRFRGEARAFARATAESINERLPGQASAFLFEEAFGPADRIHWMIHLKDLSVYYDLINVHAAQDPKLIDIYTRDWISPEKGGGKWSELFVEGSMTDLALTPQHWNMYATQS